MDDLYRPLGLDLDHARRRRLPRATGEGAFAAFVVATLLAGSLATGLGQPDLRVIDAFAVAERPAADTAARPEQAAVSAAPLPPLRTSAEIGDAGPDLPTITYPPDVSGEAGQILTVRDPASLRQDPRAAAAPDESLIEPGDDGPLPIRAADGRRPFDVYSVAPASDLGARVAIVVGGLGISQTGTMRAVETLPPAVTLAFAASGNSLDRWMRAARQNGHELLLQVPMEPVGYPEVSPGENTLTAADAGARRFEALRASLGRMTNYVGVMNYMGARLTSDPGAMRGLSGELARRGLLFLDDGTSARSLARDAAREAGSVFAGADVILDANPSPAAISERLDTLERAARANGTAIGIASAFDASVATLTAWIAAAERRGVRVVPVSALANDPEAR